MNKFYIGMIISVLFYISCTKEEIKPRSFQLRSLNMWRLIIPIISSPVGKWMRANKRLNWITVSIWNSIWTMFSYKMIWPNKSFWTYLKNTEVIFIKVGNFVYSFEIQGDSRNINHLIFSSPNSMTKPITFMIKMSLRWGWIKSTRPIYILWYYKQLAFSFSCVSALPRSVHSFFKLNRGCAVRILFAISLQ